MKEQENLSGMVGLVSDTKGVFFNQPGTREHPLPIHMPFTPACYPSVMWRLPARPEKWHPRRKFMFPRQFLFKLHRVIGLSPRQISELHKEMFGITILPHGVRTYLKAYGIFEPRTRGSKSQDIEYKELTSSLVEWASSRKLRRSKAN